MQEDKMSLLVGFCLVGTGALLSNLGNLCYVVAVITNLSKLLNWLICTANLYRKAADDIT